MDFLTIALELTEFFVEISLLINLLQGIVFLRDMNHKMDNRVDDHEDSSSKSVTTSKPHYNKGRNL